MKKKTLNYEDFFSNLEMFGIKLGLARTKELFKLLGNPEQNLKFIHIAGTNGKGSVAALTAAMLSTAGFKVGLYTSPHLISIRERFRINGKAISEQKLNQAVDFLSQKIKELPQTEQGLPSYFETCTVLAAYLFAKENVDFAVWETGMGGRLDATNVVLPELSVITSISKDHTQYLGTNIKAIAMEKAGIIKPLTPVVCGNVSKEAEDVIIDIAKKNNSDIFFPLKKINYDQDFFKSNQIIAEFIIKLLSKKLMFKMPDIKKVSEQLTWPGRFQIFPNNVIVDGAHNPEGVNALVIKVKKHFPDKKFKIIFASFADKNFIRSLEILSEIASSFIFTESGSTRSTANPQQLLSASKKILGNSFPAEAVLPPEKALSISKQENVLICGSLYLVGEILSILNEPTELFDIYFI